MGYVMKKIISLYEWLLNNDLTKEALEVASLHKDAAIIDPVAEELSEIFEGEELKEEVVNTIESQIGKIKNQFPDLEILDYYLVGASITYQYDPTSDIDTTIVIPLDVMGTEEFGAADKWIEANIDNKKFYNERPYQFKLSSEPSHKNLSSDAVYDVKNKKWIRKPNQERSEEEYDELIADKSSYENKIYKLLEKTIRKNILNLHEAAVENLDSINESGISNKLKNIMYRSYNRYKVIKKFRGKGYGGRWQAEMFENEYMPEGMAQWGGQALDTNKEVYQYKDKRVPDRISQNWATGNIVYKFLDREGYHKVYSMVKEAVRSNFKTYKDENEKDVPIDKSFLETLISYLNAVKDDEIGFER